MERHTIWLDCDETVLFSRCKTPYSAEFIYNQFKENETCYTSVRPGVQEFLEAVKDKYDIRMITQGWASFQRAALEAVGIAHYFSAIHGYGDGGIDPGVIGGIPDKWVLIDNDPNPYIKAQWLGIWTGDWKDRLITCTSYYADYDDYPSFIEYLPFVEKVLG